MVCVISLFAATAIAAAVGSAYLAMYSVPFRIGDTLKLQSGQSGRVRAVRVCYTVVETVEGATVLVPNRSLLIDEYGDDDPRAPSVLRQLDARSNNPRR